MKVHYERYLSAENWARMTGRSIVEALEDLYGGEDLTLPERNHDQAVAIERKREWGERWLNGEAQHRIWAYVEENA